MAHEKLKAELKRLGFRCLLLQKVKFKCEGREDKVKLVEEEMKRRREDTEEFLGKSGG